MRSLLPPSKRKKYTDPAKCIVCGSTQGLTRIGIAAHDALLCHICRVKVLETAEMDRITRSQAIDKLLEAIR